MYESVWLKDTREQGNEEITKSVGSSHRELAAHIRTHQLPPSARYAISVSLVSAFQTSNLPPTTDDWLPGGMRFGQWLEREVVSLGLDSLAPYLRLDINSQYIYSASLDTLQWRYLQFCFHANK